MHMIIRRVIRQASSAWQRSARRSCLVSPPLFATPTNLSASRTAHRITTPSCSYKRHHSADADNDDNAPPGMMGADGDHDTGSRSDDDEAQHAGSSSSSAKYRRHSADDDWNRSVPEPTPSAATPSTVQHTPHTTRHNACSDSTLHRVPPSPFPDSHCRCLSV